MSKLVLKNNGETEFKIEHKDNEGAVSIDSKQLGYSHYPVESVDAMRLLTNSPDTIVTTDGRYGSHYFKKTGVLADASLDNGGTVIVLSNGDKYELQYSGAVNVKWFGAKGDGVTDDAAPIQKAIDTVVFTNYDKTTKSVLIPATDKFYRVENTINLSERWNITLYSDSYNYWNRLSVADVNEENALLHWYGAEGGNMFETENYCFLSLIHI